MRNRLREFFKGKDRRSGHVVPLESSRPTERPIRDVDVRSVPDVQASSQSQAVSELNHVPQQLATITTKLNPSDAISEPSHKIGEGPPDEAGLVGNKSEPKKAVDIEPHSVNFVLNGRDEDDPDPPSHGQTKTILREKEKQIETENLLLGTVDGHHHRTPSIVRSATYNEANAASVEKDSPSQTSFSDSVAIIMSLEAPLHRASSRRSLNHNIDPKAKIFPREVDCILTVTFNEEPAIEIPQPLENFIWYESRSYKRIENTIKKVKETFQKYYITQETHKTYLRYASCFVKGTRHQSTGMVDDHMLIDAEEALSDAAVQAICGFIHDYPYEPFKLHIQCDYSSISRSFTNDDGSEVLPHEYSTFQLAIRQEYKEKMNVGKPTIKDQDYLSLADQHVLVTPENARRIIDDDKDSRPLLSHDQKNDLKQEVTTRPACTLQAVCVYDCIPMRFLYHYLCEDPHVDRKYQDRLETLQLGVPNTCDDALCIKHHKDFVKHIYKFFPEIVTRDRGHSVKDDKTVMPIRYVDKTKVLGSGSFSSVFEVDIDPHYQLLSPDVKRTYALKTFKTEPRYKEAFNREIMMLLRLARYQQHEHILTHITSWEQNQTYYILYEKAHGNLRDHMGNRAGGDLSKERVLWFLEQLRGLSDAVRRIHFFHEPEVDPVTGKVNSKKTGIVGRHHDIKPENILTFDLPLDLPTLKLSDFGSGKFSSVRAYSEMTERRPSGSKSGTSTVRGTRTYAGPESQRSMNENMKQPFDMWALGCVFLEILLWFLGIAKPDDEQTFADMRMSRQYCRSPMEADYFWQHGHFGTFELNPAVSWVIDNLQMVKCKDMLLFQELITLIRGLIVIKPNKRLKALDLFNALDVMLVKAQVDLDQEPGLYSVRYVRNISPGANLGSEVPVSQPDPAPLRKLGEDVSNTGESRVESAVNLRRLDDLQPPVQGVFPELIPGIGQQFSGSSSLVESNADWGGDNDDGGVYMNR